MATCVTPRSCSQAAIASRSGVFVPKGRRLASPSPGPAETQCSRVPMSIPAARGWTTCHSAAGKAAPRFLAEARRRPLDGRFGAGADRGVAGDAAGAAGATGATGGAFFCGVFFDMADPFPFIGFEVAMVPRAGLPWILTHSPLRDDGDGPTRRHLTNVSNAHGRRHAPKRAHRLHCAFGVCFRLAVHHSLHSRTARGPRKVSLPPLPAPRGLDAPKLRKISAKPFGVRRVLAARRSRSMMFPETGVSGTSRDETGVSSQRAYLSDRLDPTDLKLEINK